MSESKVTHSFVVDLPRGLACEKTLDEYFSKWFEIQTVDMSMQRKGTDKLWTNRKTGITYSLEYKGDFRTAETGNAFIETVSVDTSGKPGWALYSLAQLLVYFIPQTGEVVLLPMLRVKQELGKLLERGAIEVEAPNENYSGWGVLVPMDSVRKWKSWTGNIKSLPASTQDSPASAG